MFAAAEDEILFDEVLQSGLEAELQRLGSGDGLEDAPASRLDRDADDMWGAYITPSRLH